MKKKFENMRIGKKLILTFALILVMYVVTVLTAVVNIRNMSDRMEQLYNGAFANVETSQKLLGNINNVQRNMILLAATDGIKDREAYLTDTKKLIDNAGTYVEELTTGYISGGEIAAELEEKFAGMVVPRDKMMTLLEAGDNEQALNIYFDEYDSIATQVRETLSQLVDAASADAQNSLNEGQAMNSRIVVLIWILAGVIILFTGILWYVITRSIIVPINTVKRAANQIANGDLDLEITYTSRNELGQLADDIRSTAEALSSLCQRDKSRFVVTWQRMPQLSSKCRIQGGFYCPWGVDGGDYASAQRVHAADQRQCRSGVRRRGTGFKRCAGSGTGSIGAGGFYRRTGGQHQ